VGKPVPGLDGKEPRSAREYSAAVPFIQGERCRYCAAKKYFAGGIAALNERLPFRLSSWRSGTVKSCLLLVLALIPTGGHTEPIETEHLFGFTIGSDTGDVGEREIEGSVTGRFERRQARLQFGVSF
jgi:hypothetical protein